MHQSRLTGRRGSLLAARLVLAVVSAVVTLAVAAVVVLGTGLIDHSDIRRLRTRLLPVRPLDLWLDDPELGWTHRPAAAARDRRQGEFDVVYTIGDDGWRVTEGDPDDPKVVVLGGSFVFGHGVEDDQTFAALLDRSLPSYDVINAGVAAWGTNHAWLAMARLFDQGTDIRLVVYAMISHHVERNWLRYSWLKTLAVRVPRRNPMVVERDGRLVFAGLADPVRDGLPDGAELERAEFEITSRLLEDMLDRCDRRGVPLILVMLPDGSEAGTPEPLRPTFAKFSCRGLLLDLRDRIDYQSVRYPRDGHLDPEGHRRIADELIAAARASLGEAEVARATSRSRTAGSPGE
jgi:hypothetical protein